MSSNMQFCLLVTVVLLSFALQSTNAFRHSSISRVSVQSSRFSQLLMSSNDEEPKNTFMDVLSGKAAVRSEKRANPSLFSQNRPAVDRSSLSATLSADGKAAVELYKKNNPTPKVGGGFDLSETDLAKQFNALSLVTKGDPAALAIVVSTPDVLAVPFYKYAANFAVFEGKWGFEKALGVVQRNPNLFSIPTTGYGSCEVAGDDVVALSYVIAATRPAGGVLLTLLFLALLKPIVIGLF